jgi:pyridoxamine 5'-phosphate oxidase
MTKRFSDLPKDSLDQAFDEKSIAADPLEQFGHWFSDAIRFEPGEAGAMVLSTADLKGNVSARMVLLKGIAKGGFVFFTNYQSRKGVQLETNPRAALTFHWNVFERQVRVEGLVRKVSRKESVAYFNSRPIDSRVSACISPQSAVIPDRPFLEAMREGFILDLGDLSPDCPDNWGGYRLKPNMVEFWQGREGRLHDRLRYRLKKNKWIVERLAP